MVTHSRKWLWMALLLSWVAADGARGQWRIVAPNAVTITTASGAICFHNGRVWIAGSRLLMSSDSGLTWTSKGLPTTSYGSLDIQFLSFTEGILSDGDATWTTRDAGTSWQELTHDGASSACFLNNVNGIAIADRIGLLGITIDGGTTWRNMPSQQFPFCVRYRSGSVYLFGGEATGGIIYTSSDLGVTWHQGKTGIDWDSFSFAIDSCDPSRIYLSHDDHNAPTDQFSKIFLTTDLGDTWQTVISQPSPFFCGSVAEGPSAIYCQSIANGVFRSTDGGVTWGSIGGPSVGYDTRLIAAISDNILLGVDENGNVWRTDNSGGDSIAAMNSNSMLALSVAPITQQFSASSCMPEDSSIKLGIIGCSASNGILDSAWTEGSSAIKISDTRPLPRTLNVSDSILVQYLPSASTSDTAHIKISYDLGLGARDTSIMIIGHSSSSLLSAPVRLHREVAVSYFGSLDSLPLAVDIGSSVNVDSLWPYLHDISGTFSFDSSVVNFSGYLQPSGWSLSSLVNHGDAVDFNIHNLSSKSPSQPIDLGIAEFLPAYSRLQTSDVNLTNFIMGIGNQSITPCVTSDEDQHWSVKVLVADVVAISDNFRQSNPLSTHPNPANGLVWISSTSDLGDVTFAIYDMLGVQRSEIVASVSKDNPVELMLPEGDGVYNIVAKYSGGKSMMRVVRERY